LRPSLKASLLLPALSGVLLFLSFPKFGHGAIAFVALAPLLSALDGAGARAGFARAYLTGFVSSVGVLYWTALVVMQFGGMGLALGIVAMLLLCVAFSLFHGLFGALVGAWTARFGSSALLLAPLAWVSAELLRAHVLCRFPWCLLGYSQADHESLIQIAAWTAVYGVSFLLVLVSAALAYALGRSPRRARLAVAVSVAAVIAAVWGCGRLRLSQPVTETGRIRVGLIQANISQEDKWEEGRAFDNLERHVSLTREAAGRGARLVVWPESAVPYYFDSDLSVSEPLQSLARELHLDLLFGNDDTDAGLGRERRIWVGAKLLLPTGELSFRYHKMRLVPFGEYTPFESLLSLGGRYAARVVQAVGTFTPGTEYTVGSVEGHRFSALICYEAIFPDLVREFTARGSELVVNMTNDAWYGHTSAPYQHFAMARFRAVENGKYLVRAANTGISAVVDPRGRVLESTSLFVPATLVREVPFVAETTFYARHGDVFAWGCLGATVSLIALQLVRRFREAR
jgi:apolipoprotein N-acyltransferase